MQQIFLYSIIVNGERNFLCWYMSSIWMFSRHNVLSCFTAVLLNKDESETTDYSHCNSQVNICKRNDRSLEFYYQDCQYPSNSSPTFFFFFFLPRVILYRANLQNLRFLRLLASLPVGTFFLDRVHVGTVSCSTYAIPEYSGPGWIGPQWNRVGPQAH